MLATFLDNVRDRDLIAPRRLAERLHLPLVRLARLAHLDRRTMAARPGHPAVQARLGEIARILTRAAELAGDDERAVIWFKHQPIPGFGRTAEELVGEGQGAAVLADLDRQADGVYS